MRATFDPMVHALHSRYCPNIKWNIWSLETVHPLPLKHSFSKPIYSGYSTNYCTIVNLCTTKKRHVLKTTGLQL